MGAPPPQASGWPPPGQISIQEQLHHRNVQRFRSGLVFEAHRLLYHSSLGLSVIKKRDDDLVKSRGWSNRVPGQIKCLVKPYKPLFDFLGVGVVL